MTEQHFTEHKEKLIAKANAHLANPDLTERERESLLTLISLVNGYSFENRLRIKGRLAYIIVDSLVLDSSLAEAAIRFDKYSW